MKCLGEDEGVGQGAAEEGAVLLAQRIWALVTRVSLADEGRQSAVSRSARDFRLLRCGPLSRMTVGGQDVMAHSVFWPMRELPGSLVLDWGCMLSAAGSVGESPYSEAKGFGPLDEDSSREGEFPFWRWAWVGQRVFLHV